MSIPLKSCRGNCAGRLELQCVVHGALSPDLARPDPCSARYEPSGRPAGRSKLAWEGHLLSTSAAPGHPGCAHPREARDCTRVKARVVTISSRMTIASSPLMQGIERQMIEALLRADKHRLVFQLLSLSWQNYIASASADSNRYFEKHVGVCVSQGNEAS
jgi:hypothetical protein